MKSEKMTKSASTCANMLTIQLFEVESSLWEITIKTGLRETEAL